MIIIKTFYFGAIEVTEALMLAEMDKPIDRDGLEFVNSVIFKC
jgi:hypothetical protein